MRVPGVECVILASSFLATETGQSSALFSVLLCGAGSTSGRPVFGSMQAGGSASRREWRRWNRIIWSVGALKKPQITVARHVNQAFDRSAVPLVVHAEWAGTTSSTISDSFGSWSWPLMLPVVTSIAIVDEVYRLSPGR